MNKLTLFTLITFFTLGNLVSQNLEWVKTIEISTSGNRQGKQVISDKDGNVYTIGRYSGTTDFDPNQGIYNLTSNGLSDIFIQKLDKNGNFIWAVSMGGTQHDYGNSIIVDDIGNVYSTGSYIGQVDFDPSNDTMNITPSGYYDAYIQKLDSNGNLIWIKSMGGSGWEEGQSITLDKFGGIYTCGSFQYNADFDPSSNVYMLNTSSWSAQKEIFIQKLDTAGNFVWAKSIVDRNDNDALSITTDSLGNVYNIGYFQNTVDFDPNSGVYNLTSGGQDIYIQKLDSGGNFIWAKNMGPGGTDFKGTSIKVDNIGNVYSTGHFKGTIDFDPNGGNYSLASSGYFDAYVQKLDPLGNMLWTRRIGGYNDERGYSIAIDKSYNVYSTGVFQDTVDFDPGINISNLIGPSTFINTYIQKLDSNGNFIWAKSLKSNSNVSVESIFVDNYDKIYLTGVFGGSTDFDPSNNNNYSTPYTKGVYTIKLTCESSSEIYDSVCTGDSLLFNNSYISLPGVYYDTLTNSYGCDSVIILNLTNTNNPRVTYLGSVSYCDSASLPLTGRTVFTSGLYRDSISTGNSCGIVNVIYIYIKPNINNHIFDTVCGNYRSINGNIYDSSGVYEEIRENQFNCNKDSLWLEITPGTGGAYFYFMQNTPNNILLVDSSYGTDLSYKWSWGDGNYDSAVVTPSHTYANTGLYEVCLELTDTLNGCKYYYCDSLDIDTNGIMRSAFTLNVIRVETVGIDENTLNNSINLYPNPAQNELWIESEQNMISYKILSISGQLIMESNLSGKKSSINISNITNGYYLIGVKTKTGTLYKKIAISK